MMLTKPDVTIVDDSPSSSLSSSPAKSLRKPRVDDGDTLEPLDRPDFQSSEPEPKLETADSGKPEPEKNVIPVRKVRATVKIRRSPSPPANPRRSESPNNLFPPPNTNLHKLGFAEAAASAMNEAASRIDTAANDSQYYMNFSPDVDYSRTVTNLKEDRDVMRKQRIELLQRRFDDGDDAQDSDNKFIQDRPVFNLDKSKIPLYDSATQADQSLDTSPKVPIVKRRSLIRSVDMNKDMFVNGFVARKVRCSK